MFFAIAAALHRNIRPRPMGGYDGKPRHPVGRLPQKGQIVRVFVLGGTGLIGSAVVRQLMGYGHELFALA
jgi:hypothetical protein